jgi:succinylarginine dihydrolase
MERNRRVVHHVADQADDLAKSAISSVSSAWKAARTSLTYRPDTSAAVTSSA